MVVLAEVGTIFKVWMGWGHSFSERLCHCFFGRILRVTFELIIIRSRLL